MMQVRFANRAFEFLTSFLRLLIHFTARPTNFACCYSKLNGRLPKFPEFAKYAMSPLWTEIMESIRPIFDGGRNEGIKPPKLALFGGHDTTIIPLLASIGPKLWNSTEWPPYASMMIIEVRPLVYFYPYSIHGF